MERADRPPLAPLEVDVDLGFALFFLFLLCFFLLQPSLQGLVDHREGRGHLALALLSVVARTGDVGYQMTTTLTTEAPALA
ncbi:unnamed protein product [Arctogadus glacialis]